MKNTKKMPARGARRGDMAKQKSSPTPRARIGGPARMTPSTGRKAKRGK